MCPCQGTRAAPSSICTGRWFPRAIPTARTIPGQPGDGTPNGIINNDDFFYYLALFAAGC